MTEETIAFAREIIRRQDVGGVLRESGVTEADFVRLLEGGEFAEYLYRTARLHAMARIPELWRRIRELAEEGDIKAIRLYFDLCERNRGGELWPHTDRITPDPEIEAVRSEVFGDE